MRHLLRNCLLIIDFYLNLFILKRETGNIVIYHSGHLGDSQQDIASLGGVSKVLMNHDHESIGGSNQVEAPTLYMKMMWLH